MQDSLERDPKPTPSRKRTKVMQLSSMVSQLKEISEAASTEENEFGVFGIGLQLKSLPIILALEAQEHIQLYINRVRRQHLLNVNEPQIISRPITPLSSGDSQTSCSSTFHDRNDFGVHSMEGRNLTPLSTISTVHVEHDACTQESAIISTDILSEAFNIANDDN